MAEGPSTHGSDLVLARVVVAVAALGASPPPRPVTVQAVRSLGRVGLLVSATGATWDEVREWVERDHPGNASFQRMGRIVRVDFRKAPAAWSALLDATSYHHAILTPDGLATLTLRGRRGQLHDLLAGPLKVIPGARPDLRSVSTGGFERGPQLTDRQRAALLAAHQAGYYRIPRPINLRRLARAQGISSPALSELLRRAERAIIDDYVAEARRRGDAEPGRAPVPAPAEPAPDPAPLEAPPMQPPKATGTATPPLKGPLRRRS